MAVYTADIQKLYVAYFNRPADFEGLAFWEKVLVNTNGNLSLVSSTFANSTEYKEQVAGKSNMQIVNMIYQNLFNREADTTGLLFWTERLNEGDFTVDQIVKIIADNASDTDAKDKTTYANKVAAATAFTAELNTASEILGYSGNAANNAAKVWLSTVGTNESLAAATQPAALAATVTAVSQVGTQSGGVTSTLTKGLDVINGTAGSDTIIGSIDSDNAELNTFSNIDIINGGTGTDFLKLQHAKSAGAITLSNLSNIEIVQIESAASAGVTVDSTGSTGITELNVVKAAGVVDITAGAATDITLAARDTTAGSALAHDIDGGKNVTVTLTDMGNTSALNADTINIGGDVAAKGNVVVNVAGKQYDATVADSYFGSITVKGGTTIAVNQSAAVSMSAVGADDTPGTVHQGAVNLTTDAATTTITVKQTADMAAEPAEAAATGGVRETATVKFNALKNGDSIALNGLTFTAKADMTAAEVAAAFANLAEMTHPASGNDSQSGGKFSMGTYTGAFNTSAWTSGVATGDTVVFTAVPNNTNVTDLDDATLFTFTKGSGNTSTAPTFTKVQGVGQTAGTTFTGGVMGVETGVVTIDASSAAALKTVTVDGYTASGSGMTGNGSAKFDTLNLLNGGNFSAGVAAEALAVNVTNVDGAFTLTNGTTKTLNVTSNGDNAFDLNLAGATVAANLNVAGTGMLDATGSALGTVTTIKVTGSAGLDLGTTERAAVTSVDTTGTTGDTTIAIKGTSSYAGGAGVDYVTVTNAGTAIGKSINLGAGDDVLDITFAGTIATPTVDLKGGDGRDTLMMSAANAVALSAATAFGAKFDGFEVLAIDRATAIGTVNMANLDNINYVISENSGSSSAAATKSTFVVNVSGGANEGDTFQFNNGTLTVGAGVTLTAAQLALQIGALNYDDWVVKSVSGTAVTFEAKTAGAPATVPASTIPASTTTWFTDDIAIKSTAAFAIGTSTAGTDIGSATASLTINNFANNGTLELIDGGAGAFVNVKDAATGTADVLNIVAGASGLGVITANNVETINVEAAASTDLTVAGNTSLTTINVTGEGDIELMLASTDTKVAAVNASTAEGALWLDLSAHDGVAVTVTGGAGDDYLVATSGVNAKADVLLGGAGDDILVAGSNGARLTGGAGNDMFVLSAGTKEANTYSIITDMQAGDLLQLKNDNVSMTPGSENVTSFAKLTAELGATAVFSNFVDAAIAQAADGAAVWFSFNGNSYVVIENDGNGGSTDATTFENGIDSIVQIAGVNSLDNVSFNSTYGTIGLV